MEKIGYIKKNKISLKNGLNSIDVLKNIDVNFGDRDIIENRNDVIQIICAGVIISNDGQILIVKKSSKATGSNSPEKNKTLLYVGGHLDVSDISKDNFHTFMLGMKREIQEETGLNILDKDINNPILTYTPINEKSSRHLGVIFPIIIDKSIQTPFSDGKCKFVDIDSLKGIENFESWSEIILKEIVGKFNTIECIK